MSQTQDRTQKIEAPQATSPATLAPGQPDLLVVRQPDSAAAEAYRSLRATVKFSALVPPLRAILLADAGTEGQHALTAANLAAALALAGDRTILVDTNPQAPRLHQIVGLPNESGVGEWLASGDEAAPLPLQQTGLPGLRLLSAGHLPGQLTVSDLLSGEAGERLLSRLREAGDYVVIDAAPLPEAADALALAPRVDGVLLLVRSGKTRRVPAQRAKLALERVGARLLGAVLTDASGRFGR